MNLRDYVMSAEARLHSLIPILADDFAEILPYTGESPRLVGAPCCRVVG